MASTAELVSRAGRQAVSTRQASPAPHDARCSQHLGVDQTGAGAGCGPGASSVIVTGPHIGGHEVGEVRLALRRLLFGPVVLPRLARCTHIELGVFLVFYFLASATRNLFPEAWCLWQRWGGVEGVCWRPLLRSSPFRQPRRPLAHALGWAKPLLAKTHRHPSPILSSPKSPTRAIAACCGYLGDTVTLSSRSSCTLQRDPREHRVRLSVAQLSPFIPSPTSTYYAIGGDTVHVLNLTRLLKAISRVTHVGAAQNRDSLVQTAAHPTRHGSNSVPSPSTRA
ncbi:hypothetical protein BKA58DRAFT_421604 [Alternaria rosae]|uniref:uncharacterized protein n=1 Tax=Alternaria rosae TaxID=1187941 RepID=UPI001E8E4FEE|nr:uncharacterized protein BKA58DRAFT_421604 [Alternaria rosae]KAH6868286.1 hypothetical protein BKA58DRAFT_421604 [Alternaria rosae]